MWSTLKGYLYGAVALLIAMLGGYAKYQQSKRKEAESDLTDLERRLEDVKSHGEQTEKVREVEQEQTNVIIQSEDKKSESSGKIVTDLERSDTEDVKVTL